MDIGPLSNLNYREQEDALKVKGDPIWERLFMVEIAQKYIFADEEIRQFGHLSTGDAVLDQQFLNSLNTVMLTINQMTEHFKKGNSFLLVNHSDTKTIYDIIREYLLEWNYRLKNSLNLRVAPIEDLVLLDKLAEKVYPAALNHVKPDQELRDFIDSLGGASGSWLGRGSFVKENKKVLDTKPADIPKYESIAEMLQEQAAKRLRVITPTPDSNHTLGDNGLSKGRWE